MQQEELDRTLTFGESAIRQIKKSRLPAFPRNYEFWYVYSTGFNHSLNKAVNDILRDRGKLTYEEVDLLYDQHLTKRSFGDKLDEVGDQVSGEISQLINMIKENAGSTAVYRDSLLEATNALSGTIDREQVREIVDSLISATQTSDDANRMLEDQLAESKRQITELQKSIEEIRFESLTDELTTLANRKHFDRTMLQAVSDAEASGEPLSLLMTDIDHFKKFNDTFGHQTGDQVLRLVALAVKQNVKGQDTPCRYGGEEFGVILPKTKLQQALTVAEHIRKSVVSKELVKRSTGENLGRITISIGVSTFKLGDTPQSMIERSDASLYLAKRSGRNIVKCETDLGYEPDATAVA